MERVLLNWRRSRRPSSPCVSCLPGVSRRDFVVDVLDGLSDTERAQRPACAATTTSVALVVAIAGTNHRDVGRVDEDVAVIVRPGAKVAARARADPRRSRWWKVRSVDRFRPVRIGRIVEFNPCARLDRPAKEHPRDRVLTDAEIRTLWAALDREPSDVAAAFRLRLVTAQRGVEVRATSRHRKNPQSRRTRRHGSLRPARLRRREA